MGEAGLSGQTDILNPGVTNGGHEGNPDIYYKVTMFSFADMLPVKQCRNFVIWGPGANIHYGAPFFSTKRSTGPLFAVQESLRFFGGFSTTPCYRNISIESFDILQHSKELQ